jgi:hypothetical protein
MYAQVEKPKENKSQSLTNTVAQKQSGSEYTFQFVDNRPEAVVQRKLQEMVNNSNPVEQLQPIQKKENKTGLPDNLKTGIGNLTYTQPIQLSADETILQIGKQLLGKTFSSVSVAVGAIATFASVPTWVVWSVSGMLIVAAVAALKRYKSGEEEVDPQLEAAREHVDEFVDLTNGDSPVNNVVGNITTRDWYKAGQLNWEIKICFFSLVLNALDGAVARSKFAEIVNQLAINAGEDANQALTTLNLVLPVDADVEFAEEVDQTPTEVQNMIAVLRSNMDKKKRIKHFGNLDRIEKKITTWFSTNKTDLEHEDRNTMFDYLDRVQGMHKELTAWQIESRGQLWMAGSLERGEDASNIQEIWQAILSGNRQFTFTQPVDQSFGKNVTIPDEVSQNIKVEIISQLGRLMSRPTGRKLIGLFFKSDEESIVNFKLAQLYRIVEDKYVGDSAVARNDGETSFSGGLHVAKGKRARKGRQITRGRGQASDVMVTPNKRDSLFLDYDKDYNRILSPGYIGLGHELIHAAHNLQGVSVGDWTLEGMPSEYHDLEEFITIAPRTKQEEYRDNTLTGQAYQEQGGTQARTTTFGELLDLIGNGPTEASLREEHGLDTRHEHISSLSDHTTKTVLPTMADVTTMVVDALPQALQELTI